MVLATNASNCEDFALWNNIPKEKIVDTKLDVIIGLGKTVPQSEPRRASMINEIKNLNLDISLEELNASIKKQEAEKTALEAKLNFINSELRNKEMKPRKSEVVRFKRNSLIMFALGGLIFGYMYA